VYVAPTAASFGTPGRAVDAELAEDGLEDVGAVAAGAHRGFVDAAGGPELAGAPGEVLAEPPAVVALRVSRSGFRSFDARSTLVRHE